VAGQYACGRAPPRTFSPTGGGGGLKVRGERKETRGKRGREAEYTPVLSLVLSFSLFSNNNEASTA
jgi:hypothetical protein